jgi:EAL domain-containing protein (putative c-di-GMP-specific phosphodiesterase class I)/GGDEF domain-containing protein
MIQLKKKECEVDMSHEFFEILREKKIETVFQPIISLRDGEIYGHEALSRGPEDSMLRSPDVLFQYAYKNNATWELELICRTKAIENANNLKLEAKLFINVSPNIMQDHKFHKGFTKEYIESTLFDSKNIIFEITEKEAVKNISDFTKTVQNYKNQNYMIAIDDAGAGYSGLNLISDLRPHFIKLDMNLIRNIDTDVTKQSLVKSMCEFSSLTNTFLIAEGIETEEELIKLIEIGVHYGQGYFIQKPNKNIYPISNDVAEIIKEANRKKNHFYGMKISDVYISNISRQVRAISPLMLVSQVYDMMKSDNSCHGFCVTEEEKVIGVITRNELYKNISGLYGYNLYGSKPVYNIMDKSFLQVDYKTTINIVAKKAMQRTIDKIYDFITITKEDRYYGTVTVKELLEKTIEMEVFNAKHLNPLSELPGNVMIEKEIEEAIKTSENSCIAYFDLDNFKAYNDVYGFENGDRVLKFFTNLLKNHIPENEFIGHIGGDDFIAILSNPNLNIADVMIKLIEEFDKSIVYFYNQNDIDKGYIIAKNRHGVEESFPLLTVSIVCVDSKEYKSSYELSEDIGRLKKECKQQAGSFCNICNL